MRTLWIDDGSLSRLTIEINNTIDIGWNVQACKALIDSIYIKMERTIRLALHTNTIANLNKQNKKGYFKLTCNVSFLEQRFTANQG